MMLYAVMGLCKLWRRAGNELSLGSYYLFYCAWPALGNRKIRSVTNQQRFLRSWNYGYLVSCATVICKRFSAETKFLQTKRFWVITTFKHCCSLCLFSKKPEPVELLAWVVLRGMALPLCWLLYSLSERLTGETLRNKFVLQHFLSN